MRCLWMAAGGDGSKERLTMAAPREVMLEMHTRLSSGWKAKLKSVSERGSSHFSLRILMVQQDFGLALWLTLEEETCVEGRAKS